MFLVSVLNVKTPNGSENSLRGQKLSFKQKKYHTKFEKKTTSSQEIMFTLYKSKINKTSSQYQENYKRMKALVEDLNEKLQMALNQGKESYIKRYLETGKMLARDRIELLLDEVFSISLTKRMALITQIIKQFSSCFF
jgi:hypothetical protein